MYFDGIKLTQYYYTDEWDNVGRTIAKKIWDEANYLDNLYEKQLQLGYKMVKTVNGLKTVDFYSYNLNKLEILLYKLYKKWLEFDEFNVSPWFIGGDFFQKRWATEILKSTLDITDEDLEVLQTPAFNSFAHNEEVDIIKSTIEVKHGNKILDSVCNYLSNAWGWINFGYDGPEIFSSKYYNELIIEKLKLPLDELNIELARLVNLSKFLERKQTDIFNKKKISQDFINQTKKIHILTQMTDKRKEYHFQLFVIIHKVLEAISDKKSLDVEILKHCTIEEIFKLESDQLLKLARNRSKGITLFHFTDGKYKILNPAEVKKFLLDKQIEINAQIKGQVASKGRYKTIQGYVKILHSTWEVEKLKDGEVLVTSMTSPEFVPAMRKALAIITDEGGVTCHAAIVSRELGIPCIIGTRVATQVLKDGDLVEVDTVNGVVKILEKAKE
jgi:phosphohistidine swiveling domain-containing protein